MYAIFLLQYNEYLLSTADTDGISSNSAKYALMHFQFIS